MNETDHLRPDGKRRAGGAKAAAKEATYRVWIPRLVGGVHAFRYEAGGSVVAEVIPGFDLQVEGYHWGVIWPEKRQRNEGNLLVVRDPVRRVGGRVRILEAGSLDVQKSIAEAKAQAIQAIENGRPL